MIGTEAGGLWKEFRRVVWQGGKFIDTDIESGVDLAKN